MFPADSWKVAVASLQLADRLVDAIQQGARQAGFADVRPVHGFAFMRIAAGDATTGKLAEHLGVSKQAAAQFVERMVRDGYITRFEHPDDGRARLLHLTPVARKITQVAERAARQEVEVWRDELSAGDARAFERALLSLTTQIHEVRPTSFGA